MSQLLCPLASNSKECHVHLSEGPQKNWAPAALSDESAPFPVYIFYFLTHCASCGHLSSKLPAPKSLSQCLLLGESKPKCCFPTPTAPQLPTPILSPGIRRSENHWCPNIDSLTLWRNDGGLSWTLPGRLHKCWESAQQVPDLPTPPCPPTMMLLRALRLGASSMSGQTLTMAFPPARWKNYMYIHSSVGSPAESGFCFCKLFFANQYV